MSLRNNHTTYHGPVIPFRTKIPNELQDGHVVIVNGLVSSYTCCTWPRFSVNFECGFNGNDIAFHFNPRFDGGGYVVCNTKQDGNWKPEVMVNDNDFVFYKHQIPLEKVNTLAIQGIVQVSFIQFQPPVSPPMVLTSQPYPLPFATTVTGGLYPSRNITISGTILLTADKFTINLKDGKDIVFNLNPRFNEKTMIWNTKIPHSEKSEERGLLSLMPFTQGQAFKVQIKCEVSCLKVTVNGQHQFDYNHGMTNLISIDKLEISGDIQLTHIQF